MSHILEPLAYLWLKSTIIVGTYRHISSLPARPSITALAGCSPPTNQQQPKTERGDTFPIVCCSMHVSFTTLTSKRFSHKIKLLLRDRDLSTSSNILHISYSRKVPSPSLRPTHNPQKNEGKSTSTPPINYYPLLSP